MGGIDESGNLALLQPANSRNQGTLLCCRRQLAVSCHVLRRRRGVSASSRSPERRWRRTDAAEGAAVAEWQRRLV